LLAFVGEALVWCGRFVYLALRRAVDLVLLCFRSAEAKEIEILVLRHELAALSRLLPRARWSVFLWCSPRRCGAGPAPGGPALDLPIHIQGPTADRRTGAAAGRAACPRESAVGHQRIHGELLRLGWRVSASWIRRDNPRWRQRVSAAWRERG
jgi:hypothetical protein